MISGKKKMHGIETRDQKKTEERDVEGQVPWVRVWSGVGLLTHEKCRKEGQGTCR